VRIWERTGPSSSSKFFKRVENECTRSRGLPGLTHNELENRVCQVADSAETG
jgi:hypothetical protein